MMRRLATFLVTVLFVATHAPAQDAKPKAMGKEAPPPRATGYIRPTVAKLVELYAEAKKAHGYRLYQQAKFQTLPPSFDCRDKAWVLPMGDQGNCVLPGAQVSMADGRYKAIENVRVGDMVLDANGQSMRVNWTTSRTINEEIVCINAGLSSVWLTVEHPVFVGNCAIPAGSLQTSDRVAVRSRLGEMPVKIDSIQRKKYTGTVHNLIVGPSETYVVNGICVHNCGSCYLYSTVYGTMSQAFVKAGYGKNDGSLIMSVQYGMDCHSFGGCNGGYGLEVISWAKRHGWYAEKYVDLDGKPHNDYPPYVAGPRACRVPAGAKKWEIADWGFCTADQSQRSPTSSEIKTAMYNYGPLNIALDAGGQFGNGIDTITKLGTYINHEIEMVAWDDEHENGDGTRGAFLLKNQWGKGWGVNGYRWCSYNASKRIVDIFWVSATPLAPKPPDPTIPAITSPPTAAGVVGQQFSYRITATNSPTSFWATDIPAGLSMDVTGLISGIPTTEGVTTGNVTATNASGTGSMDVEFTISKSTPPDPQPQPPGAIDTMTIQRADGKVEKYELWPLGTQAAMIQVREARIKLLEAEIQMLGTMGGGTPPAPKPPAPAPPAPEPKPMPPAPEPAAPKKCCGPTIYNENVRYQIGDEVYLTEDRLGFLYRYAGNNRWVRVFKK